MVRRSFQAPGFVDRLTGNGGGSRRFLNDSVTSGLWEPKGVLLYLLVRQLRPQHVVETGVWYGWSSRAILSALHDNQQGTLDSIDRPTPKGGRTYDGKFDKASVESADETGRVVPEYLRARWTLHLGASQELMPGVLERLGSIDLFFHDSEHSLSNMLWEFRASWPSLRPGGVVYSDDVHWNAALTTFATEVQRPPLVFRLGVGPGSTGGLRK